MRIKLSWAAALALVKAGTTSVGAEAQQQQPTPCCNRFHPPCSKPGRSTRPCTSQQPQLARRGCTAPSAARGAATRCLALHGRGRCGQHALGRHGRYAAAVQLRSGGNCSHHAHACHVRHHTRYVGTLPGCPQGAAGGWLGTGSAWVCEARSSGSNHMCDTLLGGCSSCVQVASAAASRHQQPAHQHNTTPHRVCSCRNDVCAMLCVVPCDAPSAGVLCRCRGTYSGPTMQ